jgi:ubiquinone/menaquinone biosynthesis C-methylase UbiE
MNQELQEVRDFLKNNLKREVAIHYGIKNENWLEAVTTSWFDDENCDDGRLEIITRKYPKVGKVLDMAAGCGTFILHALNKGFDVWGVEPEDWKREYYRRKIVASKYPPQFVDHVLPGVGESLPFGDESFDLVTTYQTLEHVSNVNACIQEMLRVLKPGGILYVRAPDYNSFYEPHYLIPFLPSMNKKLATAYLKLIGRPLKGLDSLNWTTEREVVNYLNNSKYKVKIEYMQNHYSMVREEKIRRMLPTYLNNHFLITFLRHCYELKSKLIGWTRVGRQESHVDLWIAKLR